MFDSLADRMKQDDKETESPLQRVLLWVGVSLLAIVLFGGLYFGVRLLE